MIILIILLIFKCCISKEHNIFISTHVDKAQKEKDMRSLAKRGKSKWLCIRSTRMKTQVVIFTVALRGNV